VGALPSANEIVLTLRSLSPKQRRLFLGLGILLIALIIAILWQADRAISVPIPAPGGQLAEGIIGTPRFINPLLAASDADRDLTTLIYSGLLRLDPKGSTVPDLAESYTVSNDGLIYTFKLRDHLTWQDGKPLTADDVEFTVLKAQDQLLLGKKRGSWEGVKVEKISPTEIRFRLKQAYPQFLETTTMGILPKHLWDKFDAEAFSLNQFNTEPIGSGPYKIKSVSKNGQGIADYYDLESFSNFALGRANISLVRLRFYSNETDLIAAYKRGEIESLSAISAEGAKLLEKEGADILRSPLPRVFAIFFNQNKAPVLANQEVREALVMAVDQQQIINEVLKGYGIPAYGPLPQLFLKDTKTGDETSSSTNKITAAREYLANNGWTWDDNQKVWQKKNKKETVTLGFTIATADIPELRDSAELVKNIWDKMGVKVSLKVYEIGDLDLNVIRPRQYDSLFFGEILGRTPDLFSFWHSGQRLDPGLNIAEYTNSNIDKLLEETRTLTDPEKRQANYQKIQDTVSQDNPAAFLYSPEFLYLSPKSVKNIQLPLVNTSSDRFLSIYKWYINTDRVWKIFIHK
jgi:peptide/nickel transport system substrate-binding protein